MLTLVFAGDDPRAGGMRIPLTGVSVVRIERGERRACATVSKDPTVLLVTLPDQRVSSEHARIVRLADRWVLEDRESKNGTRVNGSLVTRSELDGGDSIEVGHTFLRFEIEPSGAEWAVSRHAGFDTLSAPLNATFEQAARVANSSVSVLVRGETGTGKELAASAIHDLSGRSGRFVAVSCAALPSELIESELFGFRKGAFSGASADHLGLIRAAEGGTLLLDEVGDLPLTAQPRLLRVLQQREVTPLGATRPERVDVRVIAATHRDLDAMVESGTFREDLLARLRGFELVLPPLRQRATDLGLLIGRILDQLSAPKLVFRPEAVRLLCSYGWPRNIRELAQTLAAAVALQRDGIIDVDTLPAALQRAHVVESTESDRALREQLLAALERHRGNLSAVARELRKDRTQIRRWLSRFGLNPDGFR